MVNRHNDDPKKKVYPVDDELESDKRDSNLPYEYVQRQEEGWDEFYDEDYDYESDYAQADDYPEKQLRTTPDKPEIEEEGDNR